MRSKNPFNVGAIIRMAHSFLVKEIVLVGDERFYERAAMGMDALRERGAAAHGRGAGRLGARAGAAAWAFEREHATVDLWRTPSCPSPV